MCGSADGSLSGVVLVEPVGDGLEEEVAVGFGEGFVAHFGELAVGFVGEVEVLEEFFGECGGADRVLGALGE